MSKPVIFPSCPFCVHCKSQRAPGAGKLALSTVQVCTLHPPVPLVIMGQDARGMLSANILSCYPVIDPELPCGQFTKREEPAS